MELKGEALETELNSWPRLDLIEWLSWNDCSSVYNDEDSMREFDNILSKEEVIETQQNKNSFTVNELKSWVHDFQN